MNNPDVIIIGAGLTGLSTAYFAKKKGLKVLVLEKSDRIGGVIKTRRENGFQFEQGPNTGVIANPEIAELFEELGDDCPVQVADQSAKKRLILKDGEWHALPNGLKSAIATPLFTLYDKFRILGEPFRKPGNDENETLAQLVARRLGKSFLDYAVDPFVLGIYAGDPNMLVTKYAMPKLYNLEQKYGSFVKGSFKKKKEATERDRKATREIFSFPKGMSQLVDTLADKIGRENIITGCKNLTLQHIEGKFKAELNFEGDNLPNSSLYRSGECVEAKKAVCTVPSHNLPDLLPFVPKHLMTDLTKVEYAKVVQLALGFEKWDGSDIHAFGGLIPHKENRDVLGSLFLSSFLPNRSPENGALLSVFMGGIRRPEVYDWSENRILATAEGELKNLFKLNSFKPDLINIYKYQHAIPQYGAESKARIRAYKATERFVTGLFLGGNGVEGIGTADRVKQAKEIADKL